MKFDKTLKAFFVLMAIWVVTAPDAHAYIDPGSGSLLWQLLLAGLVGAMFWLHRLRTWLASAVTWVIVRLKPKR